MTRSSSSRSLALLVTCLVTFSVSASGGLTYLKDGGPPRLRFKSRKSSPAPVTVPVAPLPPSMVIRPPQPPSGPATRSEIQLSASRTNIVPFVSLNPTEPPSTIATSATSQSSSVSTQAASAQEAVDPLPATSESSTGTAPVVSVPTALTAQALIPYFTGMGRDQPSATVIAPVSFIPPQPVSPKTSKATYTVVQP
jgi:hypothetical protein